MAQSGSSASDPAKPRVSDTKNGYRIVLDRLLSTPHVFFSPPASPHRLLIAQNTSKNGSLPTIASLSLHPVLESILHLLNCDLPSAHFLCRHAEVAPKFESMFVHGLLHRIEGDIDNSRAWYGDVHDTEIFKHVWLESAVSSRPAAAREGWEHYLDRIERYRDRTASRGGKNSKREPDKLSTPAGMNWDTEEQELRRASLWELRQVLDFCERKFSVSEVLNANKEFLGRMETGDEEQAKMAQNMVTGGEGWRTF